MNHPVDPVRHSLAVFWRRGATPVRGFPPLRSQPRAGVPPVERTGVGVAFSDASFLRPAGSQSHKRGNPHDRADSPGEERERETDSSVGNWRPRYQMHRDYPRTMARGIRAIEAKTRLKD